MIAHRTGGRIAALTQLARTEPELPPTTAFTDIELALLTDFSHIRKLPPPEGLGQAFHLVAAMGGYLNRGNDGPPGAETTWNGQAALSFTVWMLGYSVNAGDNSAVRQRIS